MMENMERVLRDKYWIVDIHHPAGLDSRFQIEFQRCLKKYGTVDVSTQSMTCTDMRERAWFYHLGDEYIHWMRHEQE